MNLKRFSPIPNSYWEIRSENLDFESGPVGKCHCGGELFLVKDRKDKAVCTDCGLVHLLVPLFLPTEQDIQAIKELPQRLFAGLNSKGKIKV